MKKRKFFISALCLAVFFCAIVITSVGSKDTANEQKHTNEENIVLDSSKYTTILKSANTTDFLMKSQLDTVESNQEELLIIENNDIKKTQSTKLTTEKTSSKEANSDTKKAKSKKKTTKKYVGTFKITGYCSCSSCCGKSNGITASGTKATAGRTIAADTSKYPFGTKLVINGHTYTVEDRGGAISGNRIDMYFSSHSEALQWGVRYCDVYIKK